MRFQHQPSVPEGSRDKKLPRRRRIRKRPEFLRLQQGNRGKKSRHFIIIFAPGPVADCRVGVTVTRKIGGAVTRNRIKRRVREFFRLHRHELQPAHDLLIIARAGADILSYEDVESELAHALGLRIKQRKD